MNANSTDNELSWKYHERLKRYIPAFRNVLSPIGTKSSDLFLNLIFNLNDDLNKTNVLEIGSGSGVLTVALARANANIVAVDILESAVKNTLLTINSEENLKKENIKIGLSDVYSNVEEISKIKNIKFDYIFFNNPIINSNCEKEEDSMGFAGNDFSTIIKAINGLNNYLKPTGKMYLLCTKVYEEKNLLENIKLHFICKRLKEIYFSEEYLNKVISYLNFQIEIKDLNISSIVHNNPDIEYKILELSLKSN